jgi:hypothetical protein
VNFRSSVSSSRSEVWRGICDACSVAATLPRTWLTFLQNHREVIAAFDLFTVPTATFQLLYCFFVIEHGRRRILRFNVTDHPTAEWVVQQLREAFPEAGPYRYAIFDRDSTFNEEVVAFLEATGLKPKRTSIQALGRMELRKGGLVDW